MVLTKSLLLLSKEFENYALVILLFIEIYYICRFMVCYQAGIIFLLKLKKVSRNLLADLNVYSVLVP